MASAILPSLFIAALACAQAGGATAQTAPAAGPLATPAPYAQSLVQRTLARHADLKILAFHVAPPGRAENMIVASNIGHIGKIADSDDRAVIETGTPHAERTKNGYSVELVLLDAAHRPIGALGTTFADAPGQDEAAFVRQATAVRDELAAEIPDLAALFAAPGTGATP